MTSASVDQWSKTIAAANNKRIPLHICGSGSKAFYGEQVAHGEAISTLDYAGVIDYEPSELVLTAKCGTPLKKIESVLAEQNQILGFEPPHFGAHATLGGCVAAGLSGPRRQAAGSARDFVLGAQLINASGEVLQFGGRVMKNVAGYDVSRLLVGSLGTLGLITELSIKVLPKPFAELTLVLEYTEAQALKHMNQWGSEPLAISATAWHDHHLHVRLSGAQVALNHAQRQIGGAVLLAPAAQSFWADLREHRSSWFNKQRAGDMRLWRFSVPSAAAPLELGLDQLIEWGGSLRWIFSALPASKLRERAASLGGTASLFRGDSLPADISRFHPLPATLANIQRKLKQQFDPNGIFNPQRLYPE